MWEDEDRCWAVFGLSLQLCAAKLFMTMIFPSHPIPGLWMKYTEGCTLPVATCWYWCVKGICVSKLILQLRNTWLANICTLENSCWKNSSRTTWTLKSHFTTIWLQTWPKRGICLSTGKENVDWFQLRTECSFHRAFGCFFFLSVCWHCLCILMRQALKMRGKNSVISNDHTKN